MLPKWIVLLMATPLAGLLACDGPKEPENGQHERRQQNPKTSNRSKFHDLLLADFNLSKPVETRKKALDTLVARWPETQPVLPGFLDIASLDDENRASIAEGLARIGMPLVQPLLRFVAADPVSERRLLTAGTTAYHLVHPAGLVRRTPAEREEIRNALSPLLPHLWRLFISKSAHDQALYMGVSAMGTPTLERLLKGPFAPGTVTRLSLVLYLMLTGEPEQSIFESAERESLRQKAAPLASVLLQALMNEPTDGKEEQPLALRAGLEVLGAATVNALLAEPRMRAPSACAHTIDVVSNLPTHTGAASAQPAAGILAHCTALALDEEVAKQGAAALGLLGSQGVEEAKRTLQETTKAVKARKASDRLSTWYIAFAKLPSAAALHPELAELFTAATQAGNTVHQRGALDAIRALPPETQAVLQRKHPALAAVLGGSKSKP